MTTSQKSKSKKRSSDSRELLADLANLLDKKAIFNARKNLAAFTLYTKPDYQMNWHHKTLCNFLDRFISGDIKRGLVFMPPQHGKSELVSRRLPAFALGKDPKLKIVLASYSADLAQSFGRDVQRTIDDVNYNKVFPETYLSKSNVRGRQKGAFLRNADMFETVGHRGFLKTVGVCGSLTGNPADIAIIDDPVKDTIEAYSKTYRDRVWDWYINVLESRLHNGSKVLLTMTRWHEDDLAGRILNDSQGEWEILKLPAIKEDPPSEIDPRIPGSPLWPERHSLESLLSKKRKSTTFFTSLYQQTPVAGDGNVFKKAWFQEFTELPRFQRTCLSIDCNFKEGDENDFVAIGYWGKSGVSKYLMDLINEKIGFSKTVEAIEFLYNKYRPQAVLIEDKANGPAVIEVLRRKIPCIIPIDPKGGKIARAMAIQPTAEAKNIYLPKIASWKEDYINQMIAFPKAPNDDMVDQTSQAIVYLDADQIEYWTGNVNY